MSPILGIIGTAGRRDDRARLSRDHYERMVSAALKLIEYMQWDPQNLTLVSGGAAWADHVAVDLVLRKIVPARNLKLYLPCDIQYDQFVTTTPENQNTVNTLTYYHQEFSKVIGRNSIVEVYDTYKQGALVNFDDRGFKSRNTSVSLAVGTQGHLLAFTFGSSESQQPDWTVRLFDPSSDARTSGLKPGGTADTWNKTPSVKKYHCRIGDL